MTHYKDNDLAHELLDKNLLMYELDYIHPYRDKYMDPNRNYKRNVIADYKFYLSK